MDHDDDEPLPVDFHFYTTDTLLHNAKPHMSAERIPKDATRSGTSCSRAVGESCSRASAPGTALQWAPQRS